MELRRSRDHGDLLLELLLGGRQRGAPAHRVRPLGIERRQLRLGHGEPRRRRQRVAAMLQLRDGGVVVLDGQQMVERVAHASAS